ncbi:hypothetical protein ACFL7M_12115, partial [Thermodesulfobacteriota bacterium]
LTSRDLTAGMLVLIYFGLYSLIAGMTEPAIYSRYTNLQVCIFIAKKAILRVAIRNSNRVYFLGRLTDDL